MGSQAVDLKGRLGRLCNLFPSLIRNTKPWVLSDFAMPGMHVRCAARPLEFDGEPCQVVLAKLSHASGVMPRRRYRSPFAVEILKGRCEMVWGATDSDSHFDEVRKGNLYEFNKPSCWHSLIIDHGDVFQIAIMGKPYDKPLPSLLYLAGDLRPDDELEEFFEVFEPLILHG